MSEDYNDGKIECTATGVHIHGYYFPYLTKVVPYNSIKGMRRFEMTALRGRWRIWGTGTFRYWANLDINRPKKKIGLLLDLGKFTNPFITPDDPDTVEAVIRERARLGPDTGQNMKSPFI
jgi:hypothetical protein